MPGKAKATPESRRAALLAGIMSFTGVDGWATSDSPVKKRIAALEVAWREGIQWLASDIHKMYENFVVISDAYDTVDVNLAAMKSLCVDRGVFTEDEFQARRKGLFARLDAERARREAAAETAVAEAEAKRVESADIDLVRMHDAAAATTDADHVPPAATIFGGQG